MKKLSENILDKISIDYVRTQVLKNAYGNDDTPIAKLDPRTLLLWYLFFGFFPWFANNVVLLLLLFMFAAATTRLAKVAPLVLFVFCLGVFSQTGYLLIVSLFFDGNLSTIIPLSVLTLKVATVSLASITVFSGLDPDRLCAGLLYFGCPDKLSFSIAFSYRILPVLMEQFQNILFSYRLRGRVPEKSGSFWVVKNLFYQIKIIMLSFYPLMLGTAKRSRTTVEALELKGYRHSLSNPEVRRIKLSHLRFSKGDFAFAFISLVYTAGSILISSYIKL
ncbi:MAG: energy-coupling factor transport system permease protein [Clostridiales bacterium]|jgi:energy-coupling factor transport system permease protein|nr:cobalt transporter [Oscillospiraceae bacterium]MDN5378285.1 energy-coupling factor transport system permease protein [Clostridiales bacterium]